MLHLLLFVWAQKVSQIFKILFQARDVNTFVLRGFFFSRYVRVKSSFPDKKKHQWWNLRHTLVGKPSKTNVAKYSIIGRSWSSAKLFILQNYTDNSNGNVPLAVENVKSFSFFEFNMRTCSFVKKNKANWSFVLFRTIFSFVKFVQCWHDSWSNQLLSKN